DFVSEISPVTGTRPAVQQELAIIPHSARLPDPRQMRLMPVAYSILCTPVAGGTHRPTPVMFFKHHNRRKIHERDRTLPVDLVKDLLPRDRCADAGDLAHYVHS